MIKINSLYKSFGKNEVLKGVDLDIVSSGIFTILGPNGSGKTTLIKSVLGMVIPSSGEIQVQDLQVRRNWKYRNLIGYLPQIANFPANLRVNELFKMIKDLRNQTQADETPYVQRLGLEPYLDKRLSNLSGGTKQKVNLVLTFLFDSPILILDEPTTGLDPVALLVLKEIIQEEKEKGKVILLTSHIMDFVEEISDEIVFLLEGRIYFRGTAEALKTQTQKESFEHAIAHLLMLKEYA